MPERREAARLPFADLILIQFTTAARGGRLGRELGRHIARDRRSARTLERGGRGNRHDVAQGGSGARSDAPRQCCHESREGGLPWA